MQTDVSLQPYNTFGIDVKARYFATVQNRQALCDVLSAEESRKHKLLILGEGSNILFTRDFDGLVIKMEIDGIEKIVDTDGEVWLKAGAGVVWHDLVEYCIEHNYGGIENLSLIPGTVGAAPIQNIGAYGVELSDVLVGLEALNRKTGQVRTFNRIACRFGYRDSIFKRRWKDKFVIAYITLVLQKKPVFKLDYGQLRQTLGEMGVTQPTVRTVSEAVCHIRRSKLPDPVELGNAGSFFKNPIISRAHFNELKQKFADLVSYPASDDTVKVPAGWLIEKCGWKGKRMGDAGVHDQQALVLVNHGKASGDDILKLAQAIQSDVARKFAIQLNPEVNIL